MCHPDIDEKQDFDRCSFVGANLSGSTFKNLYMRGCDFTGANMPGVTIHNCNLRESRFVGATIKDSILTDNMMVRCDFTDVNGKRCDFTDTDLRMCNFRNARSFTYRLYKLLVKGYSDARNTTRTCENTRLDDQF